MDKSNLTFNLEVEVLSNALYCKDTGRWAALGSATRVVSGVWVTEIIMSSNTEPLLLDEKDQITL